MICFLTEQETEERRRQREQETERQKTMASWGSLSCLIFLVFHSIPLRKPHKKCILGLFKKWVSGGLVNLNLLCRGLNSKCIRWVGGTYKQLCWEVSLIDHFISCRYKFEQYLASPTPQTPPDTSAPVNENEEFCCLFRSKVHEEG